MAGSDKTVKVALVLDASLYSKGAVQASSSTSKLGKDMDGVNAKAKSMESGLSKVNSKLGGFGVAAGAVAGGALVAFLKSSVDAAGDLQQSIGGVDAVFKSAAPRIHEFGKNSAEAVGLSRNEFNQLITVTGALLKNKGLSDFADRSLDLVKIGADLAAQFGGPTSQAVEALNAAMRGESDPIERYGISLNQTAVNAELARKGLQNLKGPALAQAQAQARLDIITRQSADALGTFAREADTLQGQQQRLTAEWQDAKAELGTALLPAVTDVTKALREGVDVAVAAGKAWGDIPGPVKAAIAAFVLWKVAGSKVTGGVGAMRSSIARLRDEMALQRALAGGISGGYQRLGDEALVAGGKVSRTAGVMGVAGKAARGLGSAMLGAFGGPVGLAVVGLTFAIGKFIQKHQEAKARVEEFTSAIEADSGALGKNTKAAAANALEKSGAAKAAKELGVSLSDLTEASIGNAAAQARVAEAVAQSKAETVEAVAGNINAADSLSEWQKKADSVTEAIGGTNGEIKDAVEAYRRHAEMVGTDESAQADLEVQTKDTTSAVKDQKKAAQDAAQAILDLADAHLSAVDAEIAYQASLDDVTASIKENGKTATKNGEALDLNTEKGRNNAKALLEQANKAKDLTKANFEQGGSLASLRSGMDKAREKFIENARRMGLSKTAAEQMAEKFGLSKKGVDNLARSVEGLPASKQIKIEAETAAAKARIDTLRTALANLHGKTVQVRVNEQHFVNNSSTSMAGGLTKNAATGGYITGPGTATSDSIPAYLSNGEYVVKAAAVERYGRSFFDSVNSMRFASGGLVARSQVSAPSEAPLPFGRRLSDGDVAALAKAMSRVNITTQVAQGALDRGLGGI